MSGSDLEKANAVGWVFLVVALVAGTAGAAFLFGYYAPVWFR
ncbi:MAG: hypothetical protein ACFB9M_10670 [Myxococcota bacterium]